MGIQGLLPLLKAASTPIHIKEVGNSVAVVDAYCWLHRAVYYCAKELYYNLETTSYVDYCIYKINVFKKYKIQCILVFDGLNLPSKSHTELMRKRNREKVKEQIAQLLESGQVKKAEELMKRCIDISWDMAKNLINACRQNQIDYIVAPYEADAQIAYLIKQKIGHFVITEDSDLLLFGCDYVLVKLDHFGNGVLIRQSKISECLGPKSHNFNFEKFRQMCILSGCDYLPSLPGIGLKKARQFFGITMINDIKKALKKMPSYLKMKNLKIDQDYIDGFIRSENTFKYQLVFDPIARKLVPLTPYTEEVKDINLSYAGKKLDPELALQLALGNVDLKTMSVIDDYHPDPYLSTSSIWSKNYQINLLNPIETKFKSDLSVPNKIDDNLKRACPEDNPPSKKLIVDKEIFKMYCQKESGENVIQNIEKNLGKHEVLKYQKVYSRYFVDTLSEVDKLDNDLVKLVDTKEERRKSIFSLCSVSSETPSSLKSETGEEILNSSFNSTSSSSINCSNSYNYLPSSNKLQPKNIALSLSKFAFKKKTLNI